MNFMNIPNVEPRETKAIAFSTLGAIPGKETAASLGLIYACGNSRFGLTSYGNATNAFDSAIASLKHHAQVINADAIVGVKVTATSGGIFSFASPATVIITGTAITFK
jgi:uncharacterized protein YbjQ (UPF0145 family)